LVPLNVTFANEPAVDAGGVTRDWFTSVVREIFNPNYLLFVPSTNRRSSQPNLSSWIEPNHIDLFKFAGRIIARAIVEGCVLDCHMTQAMLKHVLGHPTTLRDVEDVDETLHQSLSWILHNDITDAGLTFVVDYDDLGEHKTVPLKPGGLDLDVTNETKEEYVRLMVEHRLKNQVGAQINGFVTGFRELVPAHELALLTAQDLDLLICGVPEVDIGDLIGSCEFIFPLTREHPVIRLFEAVIRSFSTEEKAKLLMFLTGSSQVPVGGFQSLREMGIGLKIAAGGSRDRLPVAHTCVNQLDLPSYETEAEMRTKLLFAIQECNTFGFT
jgi:E3 ubiquitin-protein ligase HUWE1